MIVSTPPRVAQSIKDSRSTDEAVGRYLLIKHCIRVIHDRVDARAHDAEFLPRRNECASKIEECL